MTFHPSDPDDFRNLFSISFGASATPPNMRELSSGLFAPEQSVAKQMLDMTGQFMTAETVFGMEIPAEHIGELLMRHKRENLLAACAVFAANLYPVDGKFIDGQIGLASSLLKGKYKDEVLAKLNAGHWIFISPQAVMNVAKIVLIGACGDEDDPEHDVFADVLVMVLGLSQNLGSDVVRDKTGPRWGELPQRTAVELIRNLFFNEGFRSGSVLGRARRIREIGFIKRRDDAEHADQLFMQFTGTHPMVLFFVGMRLYLTHLSSKTVMLQRSSLYQLPFSEDSIDCAIDLLAADVVQLEKEVRDDIDRVGFDWAFNSLRGFPLMKHESDGLLMLNPAFLLERSSSSGFLWEIRTGLTVESDDSIELKKWKRQNFGRFEKFRGMAIQDYVCEMLTGGLDRPESLAREFFTEDELMNAWPEESCCDLLIDGGDDIVAIDVVAHAMSEKASAGGDFSAMLTDLEYAVEEKALQIHKTIERIMRLGLPGQSVRNPMPTFHPVIVNGMRFPWSPVLASAVHSRLEEMGLLQHGKIKPITVLSLEEVEALASVTENQEGTLIQILNERYARGEVRVPMQWTLHHRGGLRRPAALDEVLDEAIEDLYAPFDQLDQRATEAS